MTPMRWTKVDLPDGLFRWNVSGYRQEGTTAAVFVRCEDKSDRDEIHDLLTTAPAEIEQLKSDLLDAQKAIEDQRQAWDADTEKMEAEIERLKDSLRKQTDFVVTLNRDLDAEIAKNDRLKAELAELRNRVKPLVESATKVVLKAPPKYEVYDPEMRALDDAIVAYAAAEKESTK